MPGKRYYWLKLQDGFFDSKRIKKLRRLAGGDTYTIIYLKMQLVAMKHDGILEYTGLEPTFADELALDLNEEPDNVAVTIQYLLSCGLMESSDDREYFLPYAVENVGSETASTQRSREWRAKQKSQEEAQKLLQCNTNETRMQQTCNVEKEKIRDRDRERVREEVYAHEDAGGKSLGKVMTYYMDKLNPTPSSSTTAAIRSYLETMDADVIIHAMGIAVDERKTAWSYINAILRRYAKDGLTTMAAVLESEQRYQAEKGVNGNAGTGRDPNRPSGQTPSKWGLHSPIDDV